MEAEVGLREADLVRRINGGRWWFQGGGGSREAELVRRINGAEEEDLLKDGGGNIFVEVANFLLDAFFLVRQMVNYILICFRHCQ